jgi:hypothetical protein
MGPGDSVNIEQTMSTRGCNAFVMGTVQWLCASCEGFVDSRSQGELNCSAREVAWELAYKKKAGGDEQREEEISDWMKGGHNEKQRRKKISVECNTEAEMTEGKKLIKR